MSYTISIKFEDHNRTGYLAVDGEYPTLDGSEKQIAWAEDIRAKASADIASAIVKSANMKFGVYILGEEDHAAEFTAEINEKLNGNDLGRKLLAALDRIFGETSAKWWIDQRNASAHQMIRDALSQS